MSERQIPGLAWATRVYRLALRVLPARFRSDEEPDLLAFFRERYADAVTSDGWRGAVGALSASIVDALITSLRERLRRDAGEGRGANGRGRGTNGGGRGRGANGGGRGRGANGGGRGRGAKGRGRGGRGGGGGGGGDLVSDTWMDVRVAARSLARAPGFTAVAGLTLALGIGANTAVFSALHGLVLGELPYAEPDRLVVIERELRQRGVEYPAAPADLVDYRRADGFEGIAGFVSGSVILAGSDRPERVAAGFVTPEFFPVLGVEPMLGRAFALEDGLPLAGEEGDEGFSGVPVLLSHGAWVRRYGSDPDVLGREIRYSESTGVIVGVLPEAFRFIAPPDAGGRDVELWSPFRIDPADPARRNWFVFSFGRLAPGVTVEQADARIAAIAAWQRQQFANYEAAGTHTRVVPYHATVGDDLRPVLFTLLGAVSFVLLIACVNVANLILVRSAGRARDVSIRAALGGGRARIARHLLAETGLLALLGGSVGVALARLSLPLLEGLVPPEMPRLAPMGLSVPVLVFTGMTVVVATAIFGLGPALRTSRANVMDTLRGRGEGGRTSARLRGGLVVTEVALSFVLVVGAGVMVRTFVALRAVELNFEPESVLTFQASLPPGAIPDDDERTQLKLRLIDRLEAIQGVRHASASSGLPLQGRGWSGPYGNEAAAADGDESDYRQAYVRLALPGLFRAIGTPVLEGRTFTRADETDSVAYVVVSESLARANWPGESAIGKRLVSKVTNPPEWFEVIGVVANQRQESLVGAERETIWFSDRGLGSSPTLTWIVSGTGDPLELADEVRAAIGAELESILIEDMRPLGAYVVQARAPTRLILLFATIFAGLALALAVVGLYGVLAYVVRERNGEIGLRMALGAAAGGIQGMILRQGMILVGVGIALGLVGTLALTGVMRGVLVEMQPTDPVTLGAVAALFAIVAAVACVVPARRAARIDPMECLRAE